MQQKKSGPQAARNFLVFSPGHQSDLLRFFSLYTSSSMPSECECPQITMKRCHLRIGHRRIPDDVRRRTRSGRPRENSATPKWSSVPEESDRRNSRNWSERRSEEIHAIHIQNHEHRNIGIGGGIGVTDIDFAITFVSRSKIMRRHKNCRIPGCVQEGSGVLVGPSVGVLVGIGVSVGVFVGVSVGVPGPGVQVGVLVGAVGVGVNAVGVGVAVGVRVGVLVGGTPVGVRVGVLVATPVGVLVGVIVGVRVGVLVGGAPVGVSRGCVGRRNRNLAAEPERDIVFNRSQDRPVLPCRAISESTFRIDPFADRQVGCSQTPELRIVRNR